MGVYGVKTALGLALVFLSAVAAAQSGDLILRGGSTYVRPDTGVSAITTASGDKFYLGAESPAAAVSVSSDTKISLSLHYFIDDNWAIEVLAGEPFLHHINLHSGDQVITMGKTKQVPPMVSVIYYFHTASAFKPYLGMGVNHTIFFEDQFSPALQGPESPLVDHAGNGPAGSLNTPMWLADLQLENSWGLSAQLGADYYIDNHWLLNICVRYIDVETTAKFTALNGQVPGSFDMALDPLALSLMIGYKF